MKASAPQTLRRWTREEYERMIASGLFQPDERAELIDGEIWTMTPQGSAHATAYRAAEEALRAAFGSGCDVRGQLPLAVDDLSEPEPDLAVVPGSFRDYRDAHPSKALLVVEIADTSLATDRQKGSLYARAGIPDYWIVNLIKQVLEVYRDPIPAKGAPYGWKYRLVQRLSRADHVSPLAALQAQIPVTDLLP